jgi:hypothetical protein
MNPACYFETDPWDQAVAMVAAGRIGRIAAVSVQQTCTGDDLEDALRKWTSRLEAMLGAAPIRSDTIRVPGAISTISRYHPDVVVRIFLDDAGPASSSSFELVGSRSLLVWKPDVRLLSAITTGGKTTLCADHPYAATLATTGSDGGAP